MAIETVAKGIYEVGDSLGIDLTNLTEGITLGGLTGSDCSKDQERKKEELAQKIKRFLTPQDINNLARGMNNPQTTPKDMADFFYGGRDCKHKNVGSGDQQFLDQLPALLSQRIQEAQSRQAQSKPTASTPTTTTANGSTAPATGSGGFLSGFQDEILGLILAVGLIVGVIAFTQN